ncbi:hypothetical protein KDW_40220 [Dictyobacter vulcani]|uniref:Uncharacterized protein n=1 Tax=Dictyobacter vulcani TaxID=2607529 RepID=A0A5J4KTR2_9CHLR|nr:hypothetical protein KDW_40220 [Dictyobacter vulcani]
MSESANQRNDVFKTTCRPSKSLEGLKAQESIEHSNELVECVWICMVVFPYDALYENPKTFPSPFVPCSYHLLEIRIKGRETAQTTSDEPISFPEMTKDANIFI